jgi:3-oxoacyl-(acyl-carrier-protein) synthase
MAAGSRKVRLYGCAVITPGAPSLDAFRARLVEGRTSLTPSAALSGMFLTGEPRCDFGRYAEWIEARQGANRFRLLHEKAGELVQLALASTIDALESCPGLEGALKALDPRVDVTVATGLGDLPTQFAATHEFAAAERVWNAFWAEPERNEPLARLLAGDVEAPTDLPQRPSELPVDSLERFAALTRWHAYWAARNPALARFRAELAAIDATGIGSSIETGRLGALRAKGKARKDLLAKYQCPTPPWEAVSPKLLWNIANAPAAQVTMLAGLHGASAAVSVACASFGYALGEATAAIREGRLDAALVGAVDATPPPEVVSAFYAGRLAAMGPTPSLPLCDLRGTHVAGGACMWIVAAEDAMARFDLPSLGVEVLGVGCSSDAEHIITPSLDGPKLAIRRAFAAAHVTPAAVDAWDLHATGTPGDWSELALVEEFVPADAVLSARKALIGHGMGAAGGWELTALAMGARRLGGGRFELPPSGIPAADVHEQIRALPRRFVLDRPEVVQAKGADGRLIGGKLSMGIGGVSSCVLVAVDA